MISKKCKVCGTIFNTWPYMIKNGDGKFCSRKCYGINKKGIPPNSAFKKGHVSWLKGKKGIFIGEKNGNFRGGIQIHNEGYIKILIENHPFRPRNGYIYQQRLIVEKQIGRALNPKEHVHHINEIKTDNRPENLMAFNSNSAHRRFHKNPNNVKPEEIIFDGRILNNSLDIP